MSCNLVKARKLSKVRIGQYLDENLWQGGGKKKSIFSGSPAVFVSLDIVWSPLKRFGTSLRIQQNFVFGLVIV